jgi:hypothetical protein
METWRHGNMEMWKHGDVETWRHETWGHENMETWKHRVHRDKALTGTQLRAIVKKAKEGKPAAEAADQRLLCAQALIADIAAEVENDRQETLSGLGG